MTVSTVVCVGVVVGLAAGQSSPEAHENSVFSLVARNASGTVATVNVNGPLDLNNPFFRELGTNGRSCFSCHRPAQGWTITPASVRERFEESRGLDPIFRTNDGSNCEGADVVDVPQAARRRTACSSRAG